MAEIKLTKNELRSQQNRLKQLEKYLPTLQLKKAMLQAEVNEARSEIAKFEKEQQQQHQKVERYSALLSDRSMIEPGKIAKVDKVKKRFENIAGVEVSYFEDVEFVEYDYNLFDSSPWTDAIVAGLEIWSYAA